jgi:exopolysaccharide biosynthesis predicted pyruvyltransferase EpsI
MYLLGFDAPYRRDMVEDIVGVIMRKDEQVSDVHRLRIPAPLNAWLVELATARFVVTNSFHGLCFSLIFHRPFVIVGFDSEDGWRNERVEDLLRRLDLLGRFVTNYDERGVEGIVAKSIDWSRIDSLMSEIRQVGMDYIQKNVG